jgi:hypothetical protein
LNNKSKINTSKGKMYLTVVAFAALFMTAFGVNGNMNSNMNAYASIFSDIQNVDDVGQSLECVIVVVGCDAQGSVGSSGDVNIGVGDNDTTTDGPTTPDLDACALCLTDSLTDAQIDALAVLLGLTADATLEEICEALEGETFVTLAADLTTLPPAGLGLSLNAATALIDCLVDAGFTNLV